MSVTHPAAPTRPARRQRPTLAVEGTLRRFIEGDLASLRVVVELAVIWAIFQIANSIFLTAVNLTNLALQITGTALISIGVVLVLLLGEIDLSVGAVSSFAAGVMAVLSVKHGWAPVPAIAAGFVTGAGIGLLQGLLATRFGIPSFIITLAGLLAWQGALLLVLGSTGTVNLTNPTIVGLANTFYSSAVSWIIAGVAIAAYAGTSIVGHVRRVRAGVPGVGIARVVLRVALVAAVGIVATAVFTADRGMPLPVVILVAFVAFFQYSAGGIGLPCASATATMAASWASGVTAL
jgi:D-xylose transport system permease protein